MESFQQRLANHLAEKASINKLISDFAHEVIKVRGDVMAGNTYEAWTFHENGETDYWSGEIVDPRPAIRTMWVWRDCDVRYAWFPVEWLDSSTWRAEIEQKKADAAAAVEAEKLKEARQRRERQEQHDRDEYARLNAKFGKTDD